MTHAPEVRRDFHILSLDGGGTRGIYGAQILTRVEETLGAEVRDCFDLITGASTGSIIAGAAAAGIPMKEVVGLFENDSPRIFKKTPFLTKASMFFCSRYSNDPLAKVLERYLHGMTLGDVSVPLMIPSADISTDGVHVFKSRFLNELGGSYTRDRDVLLKDAILASCAAPTYFDPPARWPVPPGGWRALGQQSVHHRPNGGHVQVQQAARASEGTVHRNRTHQEHVHQG